MIHPTVDILVQPCAVLFVTPLDVYGMKESDAQLSHKFYCNLSAKA